METSDTPAEETKSSSRRSLGRAGAPRWLPASLHWVLQEPDRTTWGPVRTGLARVLEATVCDGETCTFGLLVSTVICFNVVVLICEIDATAECQIKSECIPDWIANTNYFFVIFYTVELLMRIVVYQWKLCNDKWAWFDFFIVLSAYFGLWANTLEDAGNLEDANKVQLFRLVRVARLFRMVKILSKFPTLHTMLRGFRGAMHAMGWGLVVIMLLIVIWSILAVELFYPKAQRIFTSDDDAYCRAAFRSVGNAVLLFFQTLIAGDSWGACALPIIAESPVLFIIFAAALVSLQLGCTNLVLAIIVDQATGARDDDRQAAMKEKVESQKDSMDRWRQIIDDLDEDGNGALSQDELMKGQEDPEIREVFAMMDMDDSALKEVFSYLDLNNDGNIYHHDFVDAFHKAHTQDMQVYMMIMKLQLSKVHCDMHAHFDELRQLILSGASSQASLARPRARSDARSEVSGASSKGQRSGASSKGQRKKGRRPDVSESKSSPPDWLSQDHIPQDYNKQSEGPRSVQGINAFVFEEFFRTFEARLNGLAEQATELADTTLRQQITADAAEFADIALRHYTTAMPTLASVAACGGTGSACVPGEEPRAGRSRPQTMSEAPVCKPCSRDQPGHKMLNARSFSGGLQGAERQGRIASEDTGELSLKSYASEPSVMEV